MRLLKFFEATNDDQRLKRAKAMGFDTSTVWYHGTAEPDIHSFQGYRGVAGHFTTDPGWAEQFADSALGNILDNISDEELATDPAAMSLYPVFLRLKNVFDLRNPQHRALIGMKDKDAYIDYATLEDNIEKIKAAGFDGYIDYEQPEDDDGSVAVFDPANIRSIYAKFEDGNSSNIMSSLGENYTQPNVPEVAYHATFPENRDSIRLHGLDPKYDTTFEDGGAVYFSTGSNPDPKMDIWKADLRGLPVEYDNTQVTGEPGWGDNEHWWYTDVTVVPDRLELVQKGNQGILGEAPIRDFDIDPSLGHSRSWGDRDKKRIQKPEFEALARKKIKTAVPIDVVLMGMRHEYTTDGRTNRNFSHALADWSGVMTPSQVQNSFDVSIEPASDALTALFLSNANDAKSAMPFSPWMLCHRMAHSILDAAAAEDLGGMALNNAYPFANVPKQYLTMKSASPGTVMDNEGEKGVEALAQFLHNGEIELAHVVRELDAVTDPTSELSNGQIVGGEADDLEFELRDMEEQLNISATILVNACLGKILVAP